jgi:hypothetical protein
MSTAAHRCRAFFVGASIWCAPFVVGVSACGPTIDCEAVCRRTLLCEVDFTAPDDPQGRRVRSGERSELESCTLGCQSSSLVTVESVTCLDGIDTRDASTCQGEVLLCLGVDENDL